MSEGLTICPTCLKGYKNISRHVCKAKAKQEFAEGVQTGAVKKSNELNVPASSLASISPDKFWAWTEGFGVQMGSILSDMTLMEKNIGDIRNFYGQANAFLREQLMAINEGIADMLDYLKEIAGYEKTRALNLKSVEKAINGLSGITSLGGIKSKPTFKKVESESKKSQQDEDFEAYEEMQRQEAQAPIEQKTSGLPDFVSYKQDENLPEHTRKIAGVLQGTSPKAMLIQFYNGKEAWIPKSCSKREFNEKDKDSKQYFVIDSWVLKKNLIIGEDE